MRFRYADYYVIGFLILVFVGFWPTYFSRFFNGSADFTNYFHFHAATALLWVGFLIAQPILIRKKRHDLHRLIGRLSYGLVPVLFISVMLLAHSQKDPEAENLAWQLWIPQPLSYYLGISFVYLLLILLIIRERKDKKGRWVFPAATILFLFVHTVRIFQIHIPPWEAFAKWFISLHLT